MKTNKKPANLVEHFRRATEDKKKEQDIYREKIVHSDDPEVCKKVKERIKALGWAGVLKEMAGETYPPIPEKRKQHLGLKYDEALAQQKINRIEDWDLRCSVYFYNEIAEHTQRIKAMAAFCENIGPITPDSGVLLNFWISRETYVQLRREAEELGMEEKHESLGHCVEAWDKVSEIIVEAIDEQEDRGSDEDLEALIEQKEEDENKW